MSNTTLERVWNKTEQVKQSQLLNKYRTILEHDVWTKNSRMIDYCVKKTAHIVELQNGDIITIDKPSIEKDFCFGYSDSRYNNDDFDRAADMADHAKKNVDYFMRENLKDLDNMIELLDGTKQSRFKFYTGNHYSGPDSPLKKLVELDRWDDRTNNFTPLNDADRAAMIDGYKKVKEDFIKRLNVYLKRYGLSKVHSWTYWRDE